MTDDRKRMDRILDKLGQKETWGILMGGAVALSATFAAMFGSPEMAARVTESWELIVGISGTLLGPAFASNVARGRQRAQAVIDAARTAVSQAEGVAPPAPVNDKAGVFVDGNGRTIAPAAPAAARGTIAPPASTLTTASSSAVTLDPSSTSVDNTPENAQ